MPATWSKYDKQPLPNPKDDPSGAGAPPEDHGPAKRLYMNWTTPHTPKPPPASGGSSSAGGHGPAGSDSPGTDGSDNADNDSNYVNPSPEGLPPEGMPKPGTPPDYDRLEVETGGLAAYEQNILSAATSLVSEFNYLRDHALTILTDPMWGRGEGTWQVAHPNHQNIDNVDTQPFFLPSNSAVAAREFTRVIGPVQQNALQGAADLITLSGMFIEVLDATVSSYAQMDMLTTFPDPQDLKDQGKK
ncbi:hypothetical protein ABZ814_23540 [Micromonospora musae]|uniref:hypothetical protein n=1 Tax=Micromonospora musae TaxID=1894970 RepID=UPI0033E6B525